MKAGTGDGDEDTMQRRNRKSRQGWISTSLGEKLYCNGTLNVTLEASDKSGYVYVWLCLKRRSDNCVSYRDKGQLQFNFTEIEDFSSFIHFSALLSTFANTE